MKYSAEEFSLAGDQFLGRSYEDMDCQELVERMMASVGYKRDLGGSNSWYRECLKNGWAGTPEECLKEFGVIPKGAILFICEAVSASTPTKFRDDGIGDVTHMGVKTGRGDGAIHSSSSKGCVCTSVFKDRTIRNGGWNRVGLLNVFSYVGTETAAGRRGRFCGPAFAGRAEPSPRPTKRPPSFRNRWMFRKKRRERL